MKPLHHIEVELKFPLKNPKELSEFLDKHARKTDINIRQIDTYYSPAHRNFIDADPIREWLRLRRCDKGEFLSYKRWHNNRSVSCDEYESKIENTNAIQRILEQLDFEQIICVDKTRSTWHLCDTEIAIDHVEELGFFIEIEAKGEFNDINHATEHLYQVLHTLHAQVGEQDLKGYAWRLLERKGLLNT